MRRVRGLTLVELMITIAVLAVLATLAVPSFDDALARRRVEGSAEVLRADLDLARSEAVQRHEAVTVSFGPNCYVLHLASATATCTAASATVLPADALIRTVLPDSDRVVLAAQDDLTAIRFDATMGTADFAGPALAPAGGTIDVAATGRPVALRVVIQRNGRSTLCVPEGSGIGGHAPCTP